MIHHENLENPVRCFVRLLKKYQSLCPSEAPDDAFYLTPLQKPNENCWFKNVPIGRNKLFKAISNMCKEYGIQGYKTNHSLRTIAASCLYESGVDEQLVMERTHSLPLPVIKSPTFPDHFLLYRKWAGQSHPDTTPEVYGIFRALYSSSRLFSIIFVSYAQIMYSRWKTQTGGAFF